MHIAILTFEGFNELDSLIALGVLTRARRTGWRVSIAGLAPGVLDERRRARLDGHLEEAYKADAVVVGSGMRTRELVADPALMAPMALYRRGSFSRRNARGRSCLPNWGCSRMCPPAPISSASPGLWRRGLRCSISPCLRGERRDGGRVPGFALPRGVDYCAA